MQVYTSTGRRTPGLMRTAAVGAAAFCSLGASALGAGAQTLNTLGPLTTTTPLSHLTEFVKTSDKLLFPQFNPALGTLIDVVIQMNVGISSVITVANNAATPSTGSVFTQSQFSFADPANLLAMPNVSVNTTSFSYSLNPGQSKTSPALAGSGSITRTYNAPNILTQFVGTGSIPIGVGTSTFTFLGNSGGNTFAAQSTTANATGTVTYHYQTLNTTVDVPEPGAALFVAAGTLGSLVAVRGGRRRRGRRQAGK